MIIPANPEIKTEERKGEIYLLMHFDQQIFKMNNQVVTSTELGKAVIPALGFENRDGSPILINYDYFGRKRSKSNPVSGPFELSKHGKIEFKIWP